MHADFLCMGPWGRETLSPFQSVCALPTETEQKSFKRGAHKVSKNKVIFFVNPNLLLGCFFALIPAAKLFHSMLFSGQCVQRLLRYDVLYGVRSVPDEARNGQRWNSRWWLLRRFVPGWVVGCDVFEMLQYGDSVRHVGCFHWTNVWVSNTKYFNCKHHNKTKWLKMTKKKQVNTQSKIGSLTE